MFGDFKILKKCKITNARASTFVLDRNTLHLPVFMPVATYGAMRGVTVAELHEEIILSNTYHLRELNKNAKAFMGWERAMLTDSGGFQIQSLPNVEVSDAGVLFDGQLFTPEKSMDVQMVLGADIMMQLDDVVNPTEPREKHVRAVARSLDWLDRAIVHINTKNAREPEEEPTKRAKVDSGAIGAADGSIPQIKVHNGQVLFPIIQGGLEPDLRTESINGILKRGPKGLAIGGLSGGEDKAMFCRTVLHCCRALPEGIPRYLMGVGYPEDVVVCCALGTDMSDCVYPTRTARFGRGFRDAGDVVIGNSSIADLGPLDKDCECRTCRVYSRAYLATIKATANFCMLMSVHNLHYMRRLTQRIREAVMDDRYPEFIKEFMAARYPNGVPGWIAEAMRSVGVDLE